MEKNIPVRELEEGIEVLCHAERGDWQIVEDVTHNAQGSTTVLLIDGRTITLPSDRLVTVFQ